MVHVVKISRRLLAASSIRLTSPRGWTASTSSSMCFWTCLIRHDNADRYYRHMQDCFRKYPEIYGEEIADDEEASASGGAPPAEAETPAATSSPQTTTTSPIPEHKQSGPTAESKKDIPPAAQQSQMEPQTPVERGNLEKAKATESQEAERPTSTS
jgi:hypothetical protein